MQCKKMDNNMNKVVQNSHTTCESSATASGAEKPSHRLHDLLSLGEVEEALTSFSLLHASDAQSNGASLGVRLPLLLRWLSGAQPLASFSPPLESLNKSNSTEDNISRFDPDRIVPLLEDVAVSHPDAENVEMLVSALAPSMCRGTIGKFPPLSRKKRENSFQYWRKRMAPGKNITFWDTKNLDVALERLSKQGSNKGDKYQSMNAKRQKLDSDAKAGDSDNDDITTESGDENVDYIISSRNRLLQRENVQKLNEDDDLSNFFARAASAANDDSQESTLRKTLQELIGLVSSSLQKQESGFIGAGEENAAVDSGPTGDNDEGDEGRPSSTAKSNPFLNETGFSTPGISVKSDSLFVETNVLFSSSGGGWPSLSAMVPSLMHHSPMLRHSHVANALCRSAVPQTPNLIMHMAANCPTSTPCLVRGSIDAYKLGEKFVSLQTNVDSGNEDDTFGPSQSVPNGMSIIRTSIDATRKVASLSRREAFNVIRRLKEERLMEDLLLSLLIEQDPIGAATYIVESLSTSSSAIEVNDSRDALETKPKDTTYQKQTEEPELTTQDEDESSVDGRGFLRRRLKRKNQIPLRQRFLTQQPNIHSSRSFEICSFHEQASRLRQFLIDDKSLAERARKCISKRITLLLGSTNEREKDCKSEQSRQPISYGEASLLIQAYALLVHCTGVGAGSSPGSGSKFVEDTLVSIAQLPTLAEKKSEFDSTSPMDNVYEISLCAAIVTCLKFPPIGDTTGSLTGGPAVKACFECFQSLLFQPVSIEGVVFASRISGCILAKDVSLLQELVRESLYSPCCWSSNVPPKEAIQMSNVCRWLSIKIGDKKIPSLHKEGFKHALHNPAAVLDEMQRGSLESTNREIDELMENIFANKNKSAEKIICHPKVGDLIQMAVKKLMKKPPPHIPLVLPLSIERIGIPWETMEGGNNASPPGLFSQYILQILYALFFLDAEKKSPFVINPRSLPLKECLIYVEQFSKRRRNACPGGFATVKVLLREEILKHCPDILFNMSETSWICQQQKVGSCRIKQNDVTPMMVCNAIRDCVHKSNSTDPSGLIAEKCFVVSRSIYPWSDVDVAAVAAILETAHTQPKFYSYVALCKDPLVLLKAKAAVWKRRGIRFIMLRVLQNLMDANNVIVKQCSVTNEVAQEFLASRDVIIVRCLLCACSCGFVFGRTEAENSVPTHCVKSVNMIRSIVALRRGIIATLIKQGLTDNSIDWLVKFVPESFLDAPILISLLSDKSSMTAPKRLTVASAVLPIAVANSFRGMEMARNLIHFSTAVLVDSFYLVIGPVGVPVSVLREEDGNDVTDICRKSVFRMINTLSFIDPEDSGLKNEALVAISKIASCCKSENAVGGVSGVVAARRKIVLKDIRDACIRVNIALGGSLQM